MWPVLLGGFALSLLGTLTATDAISLREVCVNIPVLSTVVFTTRTTMGTPLAHTLEPLCAVIGLTLMLASAGARNAAGTWFAAARAADGAQPLRHTHPSSLQPRAR
jgi:hypothetical protein